MMSKLTLLLNNHFEADFTDKEYTPLVIFFLLLTLLLLFIPAQWWLSPAKRVLGGMF